MVVVVVVVSNKRVAALNWHQVECKRSCIRLDVSHSLELSAPLCVRLLMVWSFLIKLDH